MPENNEVRTPRQEVQEITEQIRAQTAAQVAAEIRQEIEDEDIKLAAKRIRRRVDEEIQRRQNVPGSFEGDAQNPDDEKGQAVALQKTVIKFIIAAKQDKAPLPQGIPTEQREFATRTVRAIADAVNPERITPSESPYLYDMVSKLISGEISDIDSLAAVFQSNLQIFMANESNFQRLQEGFIQLAQEAGLEQTQAQEKFGEEAIRPKGRGELEEEALFNQDWEHYYRNQLDNDDKETVMALYSVDKLAELTENCSREASEAFEKRFQRKPNEDELRRVTSEEIERKIVFLFGKIYARVDTQMPDKTWEEVTQEGGFYDSIQAVDTKLGNALRGMIGRVQRHYDELPAILKNMRFTQRYSIEKVREKELGPDAVDPNIPEKTMLQYRVTPVAGARDTLELGAFLRTVSTQVDHQKNVRSYLHNVQAIFLRQAGEGGFYGQLGGYSETLRSENIDAMMLLPDSDKFMAAYRLYSKYLEDEFAKVNWIHQPDMFASDYFSPDSKIKQYMEADLKKLFPELDGKENEWRLRRAMSMGIGISKGVFLSEVEIAAWADPHLKDDDGTPTFTSMYTNDTAATKPLNPLHHFLRWQAEQVMKGPLLFLPVQNTDRKLMRRWDHTVLYKNMFAYRDSFIKGEQTLENTDMGKLFMQILPNIAKGGSIITRGGWRTAYATEGWRKYNGPEMKLNVIESFKALENIGYEAAITLTSDIDAMVEHGTEQEVSTFFNHVYKKYIDPEGKSSFQDYFSRECKNDYSKLLHRVYANMLHQRMPSKIVRIERDRMTKKGIRLWEKVRRELGGEWTPQKMDESMRKLSLVEVALRDEVTRKINLYLSDQGDSDKDLSRFEEETGTKYIVTEEVIKQFLPEEDHADVLTLFNKINEVGTRDGHINEFADKIKNKEFPFALGAEELETSLLSWRNSGPRTLARALKDTAQIETDVVTGIEEFLNLLHPTSISPNRDTSKLLEALVKIKGPIESAHGPDLACKVIHHMSSLAIAYFRKDSLAQHPVTKLFLAGGRPSSLAAEFAGTWRGVWEWDVADVDRFVTELERMRLLPKEGPFDLAYQMGNPDPKNKVLEERKILGIPFRKLKHEARYEYSGKTLRENFGATKQDLFFRLITLYGPLIAVMLLWSAFRSGLQEVSENKRQ